MIDKLVVLVLSLKAKLSSERGQDVVEYALITGGIAIVLIVAILIFTGAITNAFTTLKECIDFDALTPCGPF